MRRTAASLACLVFFSACTHNPQRVVDQGYRYDFASTSSAEGLVRCTTRNARFSNKYTADWAELTRPEHYQAVVAKTGGLDPYAPIIVARTWPSPYGSQMAVYLDGGMEAAVAADWIERLRRGCVDLSAPVAPASLPPG